MTVTRLLHAKKQVLKTRVATTDDENSWLKRKDWADDCGVETRFLTQRTGAHFRSGFFQFSFCKNKTAGNLRCPPCEFSG
jgi:hypothetical protein